MVHMSKKERREKVAWYIKWFSSILLISGMTMRATGEVSFQVYDLYFSTCGVFGWLIVGLLWKDRALIMLNMVGFLILMIGVLKSFV